MKDPNDNAGTIQALLERLNEQQLPRTLRMKDRVDAGEKLSDDDLAFLEQVFAEAGQAQAVASRHPELQTLINKLIDLYGHITEKALENEQKG